MTSLSTEIDPNLLLQTILELKSTIDRMDVAMEDMHTKMQKIEKNSAKSVKIAQKFEVFEPTVTWGKNMLDQIRSIKHPMIGWLPGYGRLNMFDRLEDKPKTKSSDGGDNEKKPGEETEELTDTESEEDEEEIIDEKDEFIPWKKASKEKKEAIEEVN